MKKLAAILLTVVLLASLFAVPSFAIYNDDESTDYVAYGTDAHDLGYYGLHVFTSYKISEAPAIDGVISTGEYPAVSDVSTLDDGLSLTSNDGLSDYSNFRETLFPGDYTLTSYLAYDETYVYVAEVLEAPQPVSLVNKNGAVQPLLVYVRYGLNQSKLFFEHISNAYNTYRFLQTNAEDPSDPASFSVQAPSTAYRILKKLESVSPARINANTNPYTDSDGTRWTLNEYGKAENTAMKGEVIDSSTGACRYTFEFRLPIGDLLRSQDEFTAEQLLAKDLFYGSYFFQVALTRNAGSANNTTVCLSTGKPFAAPIAPLTDPNGATVTYREAFSAYWPASNGGSGGENTSNDLAVNYVPSQIWHVGEYDPSNPFVVKTSAPPPQTTGIDLVASYTGLRVGTPFTFNPVGDLLEETADPAEGYKRGLPVSYQIRHNNTVIVSKNLDPKNLEISVDTSKFEPGLYTLIVNYKYQEFDGTSWITTAKKNFVRSFTLNGTVRAANGSSAKTGDSMAWVWIAAGVMGVSAAAVVIFFVTKKKKNSL